MRYWGGIYLFWGVDARVLIGVVFFNENICETIVYDKPMIEKLLQFFPDSESYKTIASIKPLKKLTRKHFDGYLHNSYNGIVRIRKSQIHESFFETEKDLRGLAHAIFGRKSKLKELVMLQKKPIFTPAKNQI